MTQSTDPIRVHELFDLERSILISPGPDHLLALGLEARDHHGSGLEFRMPDALDVPRPELDTPWHELSVVTIDGAPFGVVILDDVRRTITGVVTDPARRDVVHTRLSRGKRIRPCTPPLFAARCVEGCGDTVLNLADELGDTTDALYGALGRVAPAQ